MKLRLKEVYSAFANFIYPSHCLHCSLRIPHSLGVFCELCSHQLELLSLVDRCPICFGEDFDKSQEICYTCFLHPPVLKRCAAVFDYTGPAASLIKQMKYGNQPYLARGIGAYLAVQWLKLNWPLPDLIVPVPLTLTHRLSRGYNQSLLIAQSMNLILGSKVKSIIRRSLFDTSQAGLNKRERLHLNAESFSLKFVILLIYAFLYISLLNMKSYKVSTSFLYLNLFNSSEYFSTAGTMKDIFVKNIDATLFF